ncbi:hypothetical protein AOC36_09035 [Erysipelothrix larvae]|uniref:Arsenate reductase n=1 Tax=Erysipelothrix larvae TaxID=1514105 RepID=A0A109UHE2_9FIRM|nr:ArsC/Spx/MgsR family protein [Erysipelothrix larvae]AMC94127.1 hypothetical protein AOC36_09035 [Erysipelothrix larvae]
MTRQIREKNVSARIHHITKSRPLTYNEVKYLLVCSDTGIDGLIAKKSSAYHLIKDCIDDMLVSEVIQFIINNPKVLRFPIFVENGIVLSGLRNIGFDDFS